MSPREIADSFDLTKLPPEFYADPYSYYRALRDHAPVKHMPDGSWFLTRFDDIAAATSLIGAVGATRAT